MSEVFKDKDVRAKIRHKCTLCGYLIEEGEIYRRRVGVYDGEFFNNAFHENCIKITDWYVLKNGNWEYSYDDIVDGWQEEMCSSCSGVECRGSYNFSKCPYIDEALAKEKVQK